MGRQKGNKKGGSGGTPVSTAVRVDMVWLRDVKKVTVSARALR